MCPVQQEATIPKTNKISTCAVKSSPYAENILDQDRKLSMSKARKEVFPSTNAWHLAVGDVSTESVCEPICVAASCHVLQISTKHSFLTHMCSHQVCLCSFHDPIPEQCQETGPARSCTRKLSGQHNRGNLISLQYVLVA